MNLLKETPSNEICLCNRNQFKLCRVKALNGFQYNLAQVRDQRERERERERETNASNRDHEKLSSNAVYQPFYDGLCMSSCIAGVLNPFVFSSAPKKGTSRENSFNVI